MKRSQTPAFVLELKLQTNAETDRYFHDCFYFGARIYNTLVRYCRKQLRKLREDKEYRRLLKLYISETDQKQKKQLSNALTEIVRSYGLSEYQLHDFVKIMQHTYRNYIGSMTAQRLASAVWTGVQDVLYSSGKGLHFKKYADLASLEGKNNQTNIYVKDGRLHVNRHVVGIQYHKKDRSAGYAYEQECLSHRIKYCRILRKAFRGKYHYYVQLVLEGTPPVKHSVGEGETGLDIGVSAVASVSDTACTLTLLGGSVKDIEQEKRRIQRKMERSRRQSNPQNYNKDGTIKKGKKTWTYSRRYYKLKMRYQELCRKRSASLYQEQCILANDLASQGHIVYVEEMKFQSLQKRSRKTERNQNGKFKRKKRFGKTLQVRAPAQFLSILDRKLSAAGGMLIRINTRTFKASQYNHVTDTYEKKKLSKRYNTILNKYSRRILVTSVVS